jgi:hypothetical protein
MLVVVTSIAHGGEVLPICARIASVSSNCSAMNVLSRRAYTRTSFAQATAGSRADMTLL